MSRANIMLQIIVEGVIAKPFIVFAGVWEPAKKKNHNDETCQNVRSAEKEINGII